MVQTMNDPVGQHRNTDQPTRQFADRVVQQPIVIEPVVNGFMSQNGQGVLLRRYDQHAGSIDQRVGHELR